MGLCWPETVYEQSSLAWAQAQLQARVATLAAGGGVANPLSASSNAPLVACACACSTSPSALTLRDTGVRSISSGRVNDSCRSSLGDGLMCSSTVTCGVMMGLFRVVLWHMHHPARPPPVEHCAVATIA